MNRSHPQNFERLDAEFLLDVPHGLLKPVYAELEHSLTEPYEVVEEGESEIRVYCKLSSLPQLLSLRTVHNVFLSIQIDAARPTALLSDQILKLTADTIAHLQTLGKNNRARSFRVEAAGKRSDIFQRFIAALKSKVELPYDEDDGERVLRVRKLPSAPDRTWEILLRCSVKPLSVRTWRTHDYPGAINGAFGASILHLLFEQTIASEPFLLDAMAGSGTFLCESHLIAPGMKAVGVDLSREAVILSRRHLQRLKGNKSSLYTLRANARKLCFHPKTFTHAVANLPWGERHGSRRSNRPLYLSVVNELKRVLQPGGVMALLTQDFICLQDIFGEEDQKDLKVLLNHKCSQRGYRPHLFLVEKQR